MGHKYPRLKICEAKYLYRPDDVLWQFEKNNISECCQQRLVAVITLFNIYYQWDDSGTVEMTPQFELDLCLVVMTSMYKFNDV